MSEIFRVFRQGVRCAVALIAVAYPLTGAAQNPLPEGAEAAFYRIQSGDLLAYVLATEKVDTLVKRISSAAANQSEDINRLNQGVMEVEENVERNAGYAQESTQAADEMNAIADNLRGIVEELSSIVDGEQKTRAENPPPLLESRP